MKDFNLNNGYDFVNKIKYLHSINDISLVDMRTNGNNFKVNNQTVFLDTIQQNKPNYYSYRKRADELNISSDSLRICLESFYEIGVNEFNRETNYYRFPVALGFTLDKGYVYSQDKNFQMGDTLLASPLINKGIRFKILLNKRIDENWFEYQQIF
jgi:hypothetical protein